MLRRRRPGGCDIWDRQYRLCGIAIETIPAVAVTPAAINLRREIPFFTSGVPSPQIPSPSSSRHVHAFLFPFNVAGLQRF